MIKGKERKALIYGAGRMGKAAGYQLQKNAFNVDYADIIAADDVIYVGKFGTDRQRLKNLFKYYDVVLGCADYKFNAELTELCIAAETHFCDLGGNNNIVQQQLDLNDKAEKAGVVVIPDCGLAPGMANLLAAAGIEEFGGTADKVEIRVGGLPQDPQPPLNYMVTWSIDGLINEYIEPCEVLKNGNIESVEPLTEIEEIWLPEKGCYVGYEAFHTSGGLSTMAKSYQDKVNSMDYKTIRYPGHAVIFDAMKNLGLFKEKFEAKSSRFEPWSNAFTFYPREMLKNILDKSVPKVGKDKVLVYVKVSKDNRETIFHLEDYQDKTFSAMARTTGFSIATVATLLTNGDVMKRTGRGGVIPGELSVPLQEYIQHLRNAGIDIKSSGIKEMDV